jgi:hypothetical protein
MMGGLGVQSLTQAAVTVSLMLRSTGSERANYVQLMKNSSF